MSARETWPGEEPDGLELDDPEQDDPEQDDPEQDAEPEEGEPEDELAEEAEPYEDDEDTGDEPQLRIAGHEEGELDIPDDVAALEGEPRSTRRAVGLVVARTNVDVANRLLEAALGELERAGVPHESVLVMAVPGPFELPIGAMALAKTRRYSCIVALGDASDSAVVAGESASGLQLAGLETGIPVAFGVLTDGVLAHAEERAAEAVRSALEMADLFSQLRATAQAAK
jgi:6,7-dimethyl-8-ribityllumazine synthase